MKKDLLESYQLIRKIRSEIPEYISTADIKEFLDLIIKNNFLESQNVQLLLNLQLQSRTIADLKMMILRQQKFISANNLDRTDSKLSLVIYRLQNDAGREDKLSFRG